MGVTVPPGEVAGVGWGFKGPNWSLRTTASGSPGSASDENPSALKLCSRSRTRSSA
jgi:hypothetical protein